VGLSTSHDLRCPGCQAHVAQDAEWCSLCYADLRPAPPEPEPLPDTSTPEAAGANVAVAADGVPAVDLPGGAPSGRHGRRRKPPATGAAEESGMQLDGVDVDAMLAQLALETGSGLAPIAGRLESKGSKAIVITGGVVVVGLALFLLMTVLGALL